MSSPPNAPAVKLLLIENDVDLAESVRSLLGMRGFTVHAVATAEEGLELFSREPLDAVVANIRLDGMSGVDFLRMLRQQDSEFPVILLTADDNLDSALEAVRWGAHDFILKPLKHAEVLIHPVRKAVAHYRLLREKQVLEERLRRLASELLLVEERERRKLASDLHDSLAQTLVLVRHKAELISDRVSGLGLAEEAQMMLRLLGECIQGTRTLIFQLSPPILYDLGLAAALDSLVLQLRKTTRLQIEYQGDDGAVSPGTDRDVLLFRAVRELLMNVVKHARAQHVSVSLQQSPTQWQITVTDDGCGFAVKDIMNGNEGKFSYGLFSIREQMHNMGGDLLIRSEMGCGTEAMLRLPVQQIQGGGVACRRGL